MEEPQNITEHTGFPNPATDSTLASLNINNILVKHPASTFFMEIQGSAWEQFGVFHGDIAIIDRSLSPRTQDLVVWWDERDFVIKRYASLAFDETVWGIITHIIHRYRP